MAIGKVNTLQEGSPRKLYTGVCPVKCIAINPTKKELEAIYGREMKKDPVYTGVSEIEVNKSTKEKKSVKNTRLDFYLKNEELDLITKVSIYVYDYYSVSEAGNYQIIDKYGNSAWASPDVIKAKGVPLSKEGNPLSITTDYHPAKRGEADLVLFIQSLLGISNSFIRVDGQWVLRPNDLDGCVCSIDDMDKIINDNVQELREYIKLGSQNFVKVLLGVSSKDGRDYQDVYSSFFAKNSVTPTTINGESIYVKFKEHVESRNSNSGSSNKNIYTFGEVKEYNLKPTQFSNTPTENTKKAELDLPF